MSRINDYLSLSDEVLLRQCDVDLYRGSGPGGQKRNKTSSAVRLRHRPTGTQAIATESRSQHKNRAQALSRLRLRIAVKVRRPVELDPALGHELSPALRALFTHRRSRQDTSWASGIQALLDLFVALDCSVADTARLVGVSTGALSRMLLADDYLARAVNELRVVRGMRLLR